MEAGKIYLGSYNEGKGPGIYLYSVSQEGRLQALGKWGNCTNPSYLALGRGHLYAAEEMPIMGWISAWTIGPNGGLTWKNADAGMGGGLCHIALWPGGEWISGANYTGGNFATHKILPDGSVGHMVQYISVGGSGPDPVRQEGPHPHALVVSPKGDIAVGTDLGSDRVYVYETDGGQLEPQPRHESFIVKPGQGPRHFLFHPNGKVGYLLTEMGSTVILYTLNHKYGFGLFQVCSTLKEPCPNAAAAIKLSPDAQFLYVSNRGADTLTAFPLDRDGYMGTPDFYPSHGKCPRDFCFSPDGTLVVVANQKSGTVSTVCRDVKSGALGEVLDTAEVPEVACVVWS